MPTVKQTERGTKAWTSGDGTSFTITLGTTLSDTSLALLQFTYQSANGSHFDRSLWRGVVTNTTTLTFTRQSASFDSGGTIEWVVSEFDSGEVVVQRGTADCTADPTDITLGTAITVARAAPTLSCYTSHADPEKTLLPAASLTSTTNLRLDFSTAPATGNCQVAWQVIEFASGDATVTTGSKTFTSADSSLTDTISVSSTANCLSFCFGQSAGTFNSFYRNSYRCRATSTTVVTIDRGQAGGDNAVVQWYVVEFLDSPAIRAATVTWTTETSSSETITSVTTAESSVWNAHWMQNAYVTASMSESAGAVCQKLTNSTTLDCSRNTGTSGVVFYYQVIDWPTAGGGGGTAVPVFYMHRVQQGMS